MKDKSKFMLRAIELSIQSAKTMEDGDQKHIMQLLRTEDEEEQIKSVSWAELDYNLKSKTDEYREMGPKTFLHKMKNNFSADDVTAEVAVLQEADNADLELNNELVQALELYDQQSNICMISTSVKNDCIAPSCDHPRAVVSRVQCTVRTFH